MASLGVVSPKKMKAPDGIFSVSRCLRGKTVLLVRDRGEQFRMHQRLELLVVGFEVHRYV